MQSGPRRAAYRSKRNLQSHVANVQPWKNMLLDCGYPRVVNCKDSLCGKKKFAPRLALLAHARWASVHIIERNSPLGR